MASDGKKPKNAVPNEYTAMSLYQLLGAPLHALVDAESHAAAATASFIAKVGFEPEKTEERPAKALEGAVTAPGAAAPAKPTEAPAEGGPTTALADGLDEWGRLGKLRMASFHHQAPDGSVHKIEVPVLSLVPIPALQIKEASIDFFVKVVDTIPLPAQLRDRRLEAPVPPALVDLKGSIARQGPAGPGTRQSETQMHVKLTVQQADVPSGLSRLFHVMDQHTTAQRHARVEVTPPAIALEPGERDTVAVRLRDARGEATRGAELQFKVFEGRNAALAEERPGALRFLTPSGSEDIKTNDDGAATVVVLADVEKARPGARLTVVVRNGAEPDLAATLTVEIRPA